MTARISRRDALKLLTLLPLLSLIERERQAVPASGVQPTGPERPNLLVILFDTLSARHLSLHGYRRETTPNLARFAQRATVYHRHYTSGNFTTPSTASLLTGTYPWTHRAFHHAGLVAPNYEAHSLLRHFDDSYNQILFPHNLWVDLLLRQLQQGGEFYLEPQSFRLADYSFPDHLLTHDTDVAYRSFEELLFRRMSPPGSLFLSLADRVRAWLAEALDLARNYADLFPLGVPSYSTMSHTFFLLEDVIDGLVALLGTARQPFLAYLHLFPPHGPYCPRREFAGLFQDGWTPIAKAPHVLSDGISQDELNRSRREYDQYIAYTDAEFGRLHDSLAETGLLDNSYVVFTSDHGELFERGVLGHVTDLLYEPVIHVPLLISRPGQQQREDVYTPTSCVDLLPTLLDAVGQPIPAWCEGQVLPAGNGGSADRSLFAVEAKRNPAHRPLHLGTVALIRDRYKLIHYLGYEGYHDQYELYDLENDPEELENLYAVQKSTATDLQGELEAKLGRVNQPYSVE